MVSRIPGSRCCRCRIRRWRFTCVIASAPEVRRALAALDSRRWTVEPGSDSLTAKGDGPGPSDALGIVRELRVRDWIGPDGELTQVGHHALSRWLSAADRR